MRCVRKSAKESIILALLIKYIIFRTKNEACQKGGKFNMEQQQTLSH